MAKLVSEPGVLETRWYAQLGIPTFAYGAGRLDVSDGPIECIDEAAMLRCAAAYALFAGEVFKVITTTSPLESSASTQGASISATASSPHGGRQDPSADPIELFKSGRHAVDPRRLQSRHQAICWSAPPPAIVRGVGCAG